MLAEHFSGPKTGSTSVRTVILFSLKGNSQGMYSFNGGLFMVGLIVGKWMNWK